jgi:hypothetical protein
VSSLEDIPIGPGPSAIKLHSDEAILKRPWRTFPHRSFYHDQGQLFVDFQSHGCVVIDPTRHRAEGFLVNPDTSNSDFLVSFCHLALTELFKSVGLFTLHAVALEKDGRAVLIPGKSGRGKTTLSLALLRAGYRCVSDDHPLIRETATHLEILPFPEKIDVTEPTVNFFPELDQGRAFLHQGTRKMFFHVEDLFPGGTGGTCHPAIFLFPKIVDCPTSRVEPFSKQRALDVLLSQRLSIYDRSIAQNEFHALSHLVRASTCYRLEFGRDILEVANLITPLVEAA